VKPLDWLNHWLNLVRCGLLIVFGLFLLVVQISDGSAAGVGLGAVALVMGSAFLAVFIWAGKPVRRS
jgi:hypothetical protein